MRLKKTKALRYVVATFLTMGTVLSVGFLSFSGLWIIYPYIIPALLAFFLSGVVEGKVFGTSIFKGLARLKLLGSKAQQHLLILELNQFIIHKMKGDNNWLGQQCPFLKDYWQQKEYYKSLKKDPHRDAIKLQEAKERLEELKNYFYQKISSSNFKGSDYLNESLSETGKHLLSSAKRSVRFLRFFWIISLLTGVVSGFVTAFAVQEAITVGLALSLSVTALSAIVWPVALFAAIGATFLLYYAITEIVKNEAIEKAFSKTFQLFQRKTSENNTEPLGAYLLRLLALSIVVAGILSLTLFTTAASGGTCWMAMQKGIKLLAPKLPAFVAYCATSILIPINFCTDLIYGFSTTLQTIDNCKGIFLGIFEIIKHPIKTIKNFCFNIEAKLDKLKEKESWGQFFNPFRILAKLVISPLQSLVFIGHLISMGLTTDRFFNVPPPLVAGSCAVSEALQDLSFFTKEDHSHACEDDDGHDHGNLLQLPLQVLFSPILITIAILYWAFKKCINEVSLFDLLAQTFELPLLNIVFFPLLLPSAIWHWTFKKAEDNLTFFESIKKSFDIHSHDRREEVLLVTPELSPEWRKSERPSWMLTKAGNRLNDAKIDRKTAIAKQKCLAALNSQAGLNYVTGSLERGESIDAILGQYEAKNSGDSNKPLINGHSNANGSESPQLKFCSTILDKRRTVSFFQGAHTETTTSKYVKDAFRLVNSATAA